LNSSWFTGEETTESTSVSPPFPQGNQRFLRGQIRVVYDKLVNQAALGATDIGDMKSDMETETEPFFHIVSEQSWEAARVAGEYRASTLETEGFMHCSYARQLVATAGRYYPEPAGYLVLTIAPDRVTSEIKLEMATIGELFPHIYGPLNSEAVVGVEVLSEALKRLAAQTA